jgi:RimJ/RimL family protein N-acetyltransferase
MKPLLEPTIVTRRLVLRPPRRNDLDPLVAAIDDASVSRMLAVVPHPYRRSDGLAFLTSASKAAKAGRTLNLSIFSDGTLIGGIGISGLPGRCELGYWLARACWGRGFATEAGHAVLAYAFDVLGLRLIRSGVFTDNPGSRRVQAKLGFRRVGLSGRRSLARNAVVEHIDTVLTRRRSEALAR